MVNHSLIVYLLGLISLFKWSLIWSGNFKCIWSMLKNFNHFVFSRGHATLQLAVSVGWSVSPSVHPSHNLFELRAVFALLLLPNCRRLDCRVSGLVFLTNISVVIVAVVVAIVIALLYPCCGFHFNLPTLSRTHQPKTILSYVLIFLFSCFFFLLFWWRTYFLS